MRGVEDVGVPEHDERRGVRCLAHEHTARSQLRGGEIEEPAQIGEHEVLDDVDRRDRAHAAVVQLREVRETVASHDVEPARLRLGDHAGVQIDATAFDACLTQHGEQPTRSAPDVEDGGVIGEQLDVSLGECHRDVGRVTAEPALEPHVVEVDLSGRCGRGWRCVDV